MSHYMLLAPFLAFLGVFLVVLAALAWGQKRASFAERPLAGLAAGLPDAVAVDLDSRPDALPLLSRLLTGTEVQRRMQLALVRAGSMLRPSELIALNACAVALGAACGYAAGQAPGALVGAVGLGVMPPLILSMRQNLRKRAMMLQLAGAIDMICASLRAGYGFAQALKTVSEQVPPPLGLEAGRVIQELGIGLSLEQALNRMILRTDQADIELMCTAVQIQSRTGGNLANVLGTLAGVIRERIQLNGEINALTAEGRLSALILGSLPIFLALLLNSMNPGWLEPLFVTMIGQTILGGGVLAYVTGMIVLHRMLQVEV